MVIGVTGLSGAGKDEVCRILMRHGFTEINVDHIGHRVLNEKKGEIVSLFGNAVLSADGHIDRPALRTLVFRTNSARRSLEALLHPRMKEIVLEELKRTRGDVVVNAALLFTMRLAEQTEAVLIVRAPCLLRAYRIRHRDGLSWQEVLARLRAQRKIIPQPKPPNVDIINVWNTRNRKYLERRVETIISRMHRHIPEKEKRTHIQKRTGKPCSG